jgi:3',5'-cyclic-nucleotide phosphodiesterase
MQAITFRVLKEVKIEGMVNKDKLSAFLCKIYQGYRRNVEYHNDIHGADVLEMTFYFMKQGELTKLAELSDLDLVSVVAAAVCHDYGHDGFTNAYHVNSISQRAITYSD